MQLGEGITVNGSFEQDGVGITVRVSVAQLRVWYIHSVNVCIVHGAKEVVVTVWVVHTGDDTTVVICVEQGVGASEVTATAGTAAGITAGTKIQMVYL